ncbi:MAG: hypothetical protein AB7O91_00880 [Sphingomonas sp.]
MTLSALILATALAAQDSEWRPPTPLDWLHGSWSCRVSGAGATALLHRERWQPDDWSGTHVLVDEVRGGVRVGAQPLANGRILGRGDDFVLTHRMRGASSPTPAIYHSVRVGERAVEFVTDEAVSPQRIVYRRTATALVVTHSRRDGGAARTWRMLSEDDSAGDRACDGGR